MLKCTAFFILRNAGWSESYFREGTNPTAAVNAFVQLINTRLGMCVAAVGTNGARIAVIENPSIVRAFGLNGSGAIAEPSDVTNAAILWKASAASGVKRQVWTRGQPDETLLGGAYTPSSAFSMAAAQWANVVYGNEWCIRTQNRTDWPLQDIESIGGTGILTTYLNDVFDKPMSLKFYKARDTLGNPIRKIYRIGAKLTATTYQLVNWEAGRTAFNVRARNYILVLQPITTIAINKGGTRRTGRPFGLPVGRSRART